MTTEYKAYEANPLGYLKMAAELAGLKWPEKTFERVARGRADYDAARLIIAHAKTLSKHEPLPDPVVECLEKAHAAWVTRPDTLSLANVLAAALRSAGLVKS